MLAACILISVLAPTAVAEAPPHSLLTALARKLVREKPQILNTFSSDQQAGTVVTPPSLPDAPLLDARTAGYEGLTEESTEIVRGLVEAFFNRQSLQDGEAACLSKGAGNLAGDVTAVAANLFALLEGVIGKHGGNPKSAKHGEASVKDGAGDISHMVDGMMDGGNEEPTGVVGEEVDDVRGPGDEAKVREAQKNLGFFYSGRRLRMNLHLMSAAPGIVMQMGMAAEKIVAVSHEVVQECLHKDALDALEKSARHMHSLQDIGGHLIANGQDIVWELGDALTAYKAHNFRKFGSDFGTALRKTFLCNATGQGGLPEGKPDEAVVSNITEGLLKGFFGEGSELNLRLPGGTDYEPATIPIDLHQCIADNADLFQNVWVELMWVYAKRTARVSSKEEMQWSTAVAFTMMQLPTALEKCSMGPEEQRMLEDAIMGLSSGSEGIKWDFRLPEDARVSTDRMEKHMAITMKDWADQHWEVFGEDLGKLLQEMALIMFDRKYSLDSGGLLRKALQRPAFAGRAASPIAISLGLALVGAAAGGLAAFRLIGASLHRGEADISECTDEEASE